MTDLTTLASSAHPVLVARLAAALGKMSPGPLGNTNEAAPQTDEM
jgi:hypothetical protein